MGPCYKAQRRGIPVSVSVWEHIGNIDCGIVSTLKYGSNILYDGTQHFEGYFVRLVFLPMRRLELS